MAKGNPRAVTKGVNQAKDVIIEEANTDAVQELVTEGSKEDQQPQR